MVKDPGFNPGILPLPVLVNQRAALIICILVYRFYLLPILLNHSFAKQTRPQVLVWVPLYWRAHTHSD